MSQTFLKKTAGVTLIELLLALVISTILTAVIYRSFIGQHRTYYVQRDVADMQQNARVAVNRMLREIRMAGFGGKNESLFGESDILKIFGNVNGYSAIITPEDNVITDGITHDRVSVIAAYNQIATLKVDPKDADYPYVKAGKDTFTLSYKSSAVFNNDKKKYLCFNGRNLYSVKTEAGGTITLTANLKEDHKDGEPVFLIEAITFGLRLNPPTMPVLFRNQNTGGGRVTMAENIESLRFRYRVWKKSDKSDGGEVDSPDLVNYVIVGVRVTLVARTMDSDPQLKVGDGFRRRTVETYIDVRNMKS